MLIKRLLINDWLGLLWSLKFIKSSANRNYELFTEGVFFFIKCSSSKFLIICQVVSPNNTVFNYFSQTFSNIFWELVHEFRISSVINLRVLRNFYWFDLLDVPPIWTLVISENIQPCKIEVKLRVMEEGGARVAALELTST